MARYRQLETNFWQDSFVLDLTPEEKFFYIYLMTNPRTTQCGIYEIPKRMMEAETGYNRETIDKLLKRFVEYGKILYCEESKEVMIVNWLKYNSINSPKVKACIRKELETVKNKEFLQRFYTFCEELGYGIDRVSEEKDTVSIDLGEEEEIEKEKRKESVEDPSSKAVPYDPILSLYHEHCISLPRVQSVTEKRKKAMRVLYKKYKNLAIFKQIFEKAEASDFLTGRSGRWTSCNFDWLLKESNMVKVLEGSYDNKDSPEQKYTNKTSVTAEETDRENEKIREILLAQGIQV